MHEFHSNSWPELLFAYVEYYFWIPGELGLRSIPTKAGPEELPSEKVPFGEVGKRLRRGERSLNAAFNILFRILPDSLGRRLLGSFRTNGPIELQGTSQFIAFNTWIKDLENVCQPDVTLEYENARIFLEMKVDSHFRLEQLQKYLIGLARWRKEQPNQSKQDLLLLLSPRDLVKQWQPAERAEIFKGAEPINDLYDHLKIASLRPKVGTIGDTTQISSDVRAVAENVTLGFATWQDVGDCLCNCLREQSAPECGIAGEVLHRLLGDFLNELARRKLWIMQETH